MDKEKEIERMVQIAYNYSKAFANTPYYKGVKTDMEAIYEAGYRKADEVSKETAKEIVDLLIQYDDGDSNTEAVELIVERYGLQDYIKENFFVLDEEDYE